MCSIYIFLCLWSTKFSDLIVNLESVGCFDLHPTALDPVRKFYYYCVLTLSIPLSMVNQNFSFNFENGKHKMFWFFFVPDSMWPCEVILLFCVLNLYIPMSMVNQNFWFNFEYGKRRMFWFYFLPNSMWPCEVILLFCVLTMYSYF